MLPNNENRDRAHDKSLGDFQKIFSDAIVNARVCFDINPVNGMNVYKNNFRLTLLNCLQTTFVQTQALIHDDDFKELAFGYIDLYPSRHEDLNAYGKCFPLYLKQRVSELLSDIAQYDWLKQCCYYASNHTEFDLQNFLSLEEKNQLSAYFIKPDSLLLFNSAFPLLDIISSDIKGVEVDVDGVNQQYYFLFYRELGKVQCKRIEENTFNSLEFFTRAHSLKELKNQQLTDFLPLLQKGYLTIDDSVQDHV